MIKVIPIVWVVIAAFCTLYLVFVSPAYSAEIAGHTQIVVDATQPPKEISPDLIGVFFEDINYAADGGLYAELVQNRSFEYNAKDNRSFQPLTAWTLTADATSTATINVQSEKPINKNNTNYAVITVDRSSGGDGVRLTNDGFGGITVKQGHRYNFSFYSRRLAGTATPATVRIESKSGQVLAAVHLPQMTNEWACHKAVLEVKTDAGDGRLVLGISGTGKFAIDMVSLFPEQTFRGRTNGLRADLAQTIADLKPKFMRFPGGCVVHGDGAPNFYRWKDTIGPIEQRKGQPDIWRYHQGVGLGYFEYFQFCEDIGAKPLPVVPAGVSCQNSYGKPGTGQEPVPMDQMPAYINDVLDLVEWANGPADSTWGAKRAAAGHPKPFGLKYVGVGNEDHITPEFKERFTMIFDAVKAKYPEITVIGTVGPAYQGFDYEHGWAFAREVGVPMVDEHYYVSPAWFLNNSRFYDSYPRSGPKVYLGEYAGHDFNRHNTLRAALSEASYLTALERNGDVVRFASYAPLLARIGNTQWEPDLIHFSNSQVIPTISYQVQKLFSNNSGDRYLPTDIRQTESGPRFGNQLFLGSWDSSVEFNDVTVTRGDQQLFHDDFADAQKSQTSWSPNGGNWTVSPQGTYRQNELARPALSVIKGFQTDGNFVYAFRARKLRGSEGFLAGFHGCDPGNFYWWNIGGFGNSRLVVEKSTGGKRSDATNGVEGHIELNRWYDVRIESTDGQIRCYLDNKMIHEFQDTGFKLPPDLFASTVRDSRSGDVIIKMVNNATTAAKVAVQIDGNLNIGMMATATVLTGDLDIFNTPEAPQQVMPATAPIPITRLKELELPGASLTVIRIPMKQGR